MGYYTEFSGAFTITPPLEVEQVALINILRDDVVDTIAIRDMLQCIPIARDGGEITSDWWASATELGMPIGVNRHPWWYQWLEYIVTYHTMRWGRTLTGTILWRGDEWYDQGEITITPEGKIERTYRFVTEEEIPTDDD